MTEPLFFADPLPEAGATLTLAGDEARHAAGSRRLKPGDNLWLFDGRGGLARAELLGPGGRGHALQLRVQARRAEPPPQPPLHLCCALPKGDRQQILLDMATQLGMTAFTPLVCARSVARPGAASRARWQRICLQACKQSRRPWLPVIHAPATPQALAQAAAAKHDVWIAHPGARTSPAAALAMRGDPARGLTILIGPEGGFTPEEVEAAVAAGALAVALGAAVLRIETAAIALLALLQLGAGGAQAGRTRGNAAAHDPAPPAAHPSSC
jgi:16S rRNA (uracil1498-N3)-methyltransferase